MRPLIVGSVMLTLNIIKKSREKYERMAEEEALKEKEAHRKGKFITVQVMIDFLYSTFGKLHKIQALQEKE